LAHATSFNYREALYAPLQQLILPQAKIIFPHLKTTEAMDSKSLIAHSDLVLAEVSYPSTGTGIELGWANMLNKPIYCLYQANRKYSTSLAVITTHMIAYENSQELSPAVINIYETWERA
jgi:nucleoside 2-deoxyribosyltransferase